MKQILLCAALLAGCSAAGEPPPTSLIEYDMRVRPADESLTGSALSAAARIEAASGLVVLVADRGPGVLMTRSAPDGDGEWLGSWQPGRNTIDVDGDCPEHTLETLVLHEMLHALGAEHVRQDTGVMSRLIYGDLPITSADLESLCASVSCAVFRPEVN